MSEKLIKFNIGSTDIFLENYDFGQGKITISGPDNNWSYYWGSMQDTIEDFLQRCDSGYFAGKLCNNSYEFCNKRTFKALREYLFTEIPYISNWYENKEFQKSLRESINAFQRDVASVDQFIHEWDYFIGNIEYELIEDYAQERSVTESLQGITEQWDFLATNISEEYKKLQVLHKKICEVLKKKQVEVFEKIS